MSIWAKDTCHQLLASSCPPKAYSSVEMKRVAKTLRKEQEGILNWQRKGSTNSFLEGLNSLIQSAESAARGFRNTVYFRTMIFLRLGNSTLRPRVSLHALPTRDREEPI
ncbi:transposase [Atopobium sp. oral taxon 416]|uniref:transposase n=1 Tax=Atopobium sp. oral taxon 416 TaxID=712157 RepID=UPI001BAB36E3|nr:transposase [Atopobium sp. oral taxon 416]QUC04778.1 transposase [Atopobium sp. oral taxon 416]